MPAAEPSSTQAPGSDDHDLAAFGYKPSLDRSIGEFAGFATGVSYISIPHRHVPALLFRVRLRLRRRRPGLPVELTASIVTLSAVVLALQITLPRLWPAVQVIGGGSGSASAADAVLLGTVMIILTTVINALDVGAPWYNTFGAFLYTGVILGSGLLWFAIKGRHSTGTLASHAVSEKEEAA